MTVMDSNLILAEFIIKVQHRRVAEGQTRPRHGRSARPESKSKSKSKSKPRAV